MPIEAGWWYASFAFWDFSRRNKHCIHLSTTKTIYFSCFAYAMTAFQKQSSGVVRPQACNFIKKERCFPVNFAKFLRQLFSQNTSSGCFWHLHLPRFPILILLHVIHRQLRRECVISFDGGEWWSERLHFQMNFPQNNHFIHILMNKVIILKIHVKMKPFINVTLYFQ